MVGIVVVSHSRALARGAVALAQEMVQGSPVRLVVAAGLDEDTLGTDAAAIMEAIREADDGESGVVVLMDLGSAVLSAELALDLLDHDARTRVLLSPAPLVEGLVVAAAAAAGGACREEVAAEAMGALAAKQAHLAAPAAGPADAGHREQALPSTGTDSAPLRARFTVRLRHGLHARPAALLVQRVRAFDADVRLRNLTTGAGPVPAASLSQVAALGALDGHELEAGATGPRAREALEAVLALAARNFGEASPDGATLTGLAASPGVGIGPGWSHSDPPIEVSDGADPADAATGDPLTEWRRLTEAIGTAARELRALRARTAAEVGEAEAAVFDAHLLFLQDAHLLDGVRVRIDGGQAAASAWAAGVAAVERQFAELADPYARARAADVRDVGDRVLRQLLDLVEVPPDGDGVLVASDLSPSQAAGLTPGRVAAVVLAAGSPTAHSVILLRAKGIPAVVAVGTVALDLPDGAALTVDGTAGRVVVAPAADDQPTG